MWGSKILRQNICIFVLTLFLIEVFGIVYFFFKEDRIKQRAKGIQKFIFEARFLSLELEDAEIFSYAVF